MTHKICLRILKRYKGKKLTRHELAKLADRSLGAIDRAMTYLIEMKQAKKILKTAQPNDRRTFKMYYYV